MTARLAALVAAVFLVAGCDVPTNDEPVELTGPFASLETTTTSTTAPEGDTREVVVYMLRTRGGRTVLEPVERSVDLDADIQDVLRALFTQPPTEQEPGLATAIPSSATLLSAVRSINEPSRVIVDVRGLFGDAQGPTLRNALAQIVWTATEEQTGYDEVLFRNDGQPADALVDQLEITSEPVTREDYDEPQS